MGGLVPKGKSLLGSHQGRRGGDTEQRADASLHKALWSLSFFSAIPGPSWV